jgi:hypothetical protein
MQRRPLWILAIVCLYAGCATHPPSSETQAMVDRIARERPSNAYCELPRISYCEADVLGKKHCACVQRHEVFGW